MEISGLEISIMFDKDCVIAIITRFLFKNWKGNSKCNVEISVNLTSRNHYNVDRAISKFMPGKFHLCE